MKEFLEKIRRERREFMDRTNEQGYTCMEIQIGKYMNLPIEWLVINEDEKSLLLLSKYIISLLPCCENNFHVLPWKDSHIRKWLNDVFFHQAFNIEEKKLIVEGLSDDKDNVFLLSKSEVVLYLRDKYRKEIFAEVTDNAIEEFKYKRKHMPNDEIIYGDFYKEPYMSWWLRDYDRGYYYYCSPDGFFGHANSYYEYHMGAELTFDLGIRPAIYVDKLLFSKMIEK